VADVRAYSLNGAAMALLQDLRCWPDSPDVTPVHRMQIWGDQGGQLNFGAQAQGVGELNWMVDVPALEKRLAQAVQFQPHIEVVSAPVAAPLTVVCEGRASQTRAELGVGFEVTHYEQHAVATRLVCELPHQGVARQWFGWSAVPGLSQPQAEILALLPLGGEGGSEVALVWSVHPLRAKTLMALEAEAFALELSKACGLALGHMTVSAPRAEWPLQLARAERWTGNMPGCSARHPPLGGARPECGLGRCRRVGAGHQNQRILAPLERLETAAPLRTGTTGRRESHGSRDRRTATPVCATQPLVATAAQLGHDWL
jgi:2-polyprenyl-6-methoxyphenol hydroxylase-like FAD-dependent oxidoreductase